MKLYFGGPIVTMEEALPRAGALLEDGGRIAALGSEADLRLAFPKAERVDLGGCALLPAFLDAHSHFSSEASGQLQLSLEGCASWEELAEKLKAFLRDRKLPKGAWVLAKGYDDNLLAQRRHPTAAFLDRAAPDNPVLLQHKSGHTGVCNSAALAALGITPSTPDPAGGHYGRENGALTGFLEENAYFENIRKTPVPGPGALLDAYRQAQNIYASHGIATVQEGMMVPQMAPLYGALLGSGLLKLDLVGYPEFSAAEQLFRDYSAYADGYLGHFRLGGVKIFLDGSPQERTAWMRPQSAYLPAAPGGQRETGSGVMTDEAVLAALSWAAEHRVQILAHCNGDRAAQQYLDAIEETERRYPDFAALRPVMIHAQFLAPDQLPQVKRTGVLPSFFAAHVYHWGDIHLRNFGADRAGLISPAADALKAGIRFTFHQDTPVIEPDMLETVWCAVNRVTKSGAVLGGNERISPREALKAVTLNAAWQYGEEGEKGSLKAGKNADFALLDQDPLTADPERIREIQVLRTVKNGETIYQRD